MKELKIHYAGQVFSFVPAPPGEQELGFSQQAGSPVEDACIGHLRGDFGASGQQFFTTWWPHNRSRQTERFKCELEDVVNSLRQNGLLASRSVMQARCARHAPAVVGSRNRKELCFRLDTEDCRYYLRCIPGKGAYNFYLYCYDRPALEAVWKQRQQIHCRPVPVLAAGEVQE